MTMNGLPSATRQHRLRVGDWVQVRSAQEIFATLDEQSRLDGLPFMPEMLQFCGKRYRVNKSAHKTCDTIRSSRSRWMADAVHLEGLRCDGTGHGGCQAACLLFWKTAWLIPVRHEDASQEFVSEIPPEHGDRPQDHRLAALAESTCVPALEGGDGNKRYSCQATELLKATTPLDWWDPRQYALDLSLGNVSIRDFIYYAMIAARNVARRKLTGDPSYP